MDKPTIFIFLVSLKSSRLPTIVSYAKDFLAGLKVESSPMILTPHRPASQARTEIVLTHIREYPFYTVLPIPSHNVATLPSPLGCLGPACLQPQQPSPGRQNTARKRSSVHHIGSPHDNDLMCIVGLKTLP